MADINAHARTVRALLSGRKYAIDYFQREYRWGEKQISELVRDLSNKFLASWRTGQERSAVARYAPYFLGSIIAANANADGRRSIIDGQQRLTSITLLLIALRHRLENEDDRRQISDLVFTTQFGERSFNIDVPERTAAMHAIFSGETLDPDGQPESVRTILARYEDIGEMLPDQISGVALSMFADWLIDRVFLVEIETPNEDGGYEVFEAMNDRGLALTPTDMLKSHLLSRITGKPEKIRLNRLWKERIEALAALGKDEDADAIKSWLRAAFAETIRERVENATPQDFDRIGTEFHRWVRDKSASLKLENAESYRIFVERDFAFYTRWYERCRKWADSPIPGFETIFCNADAKFTLQYPLLLAPLGPNDSEESAIRKIRTVARFIDIYSMRRMWAGKSVDYNTIQYAMFIVLKAIRGLDAPAVADRLLEYLERETDPLGPETAFVYRPNGFNKSLRRLLARLTTWVEVQAGLADQLGSYLQSGRGGFEIEHIWANHPERYVDEIPDGRDFADVRNRLGGLLLLPKSFNASYGALPYRVSGVDEATEEAAKKKRHKYPLYFGQNLLAASLHENAYVHNPGFRQMRESTRLPFRAHPEFKRQDLEERHALYVAIAAKVWDPNLIRAEAAS
jgi:hypothetical protein